MEIRATRNQESAGISTGHRWNLVSPSQINAASSLARSPRARSIVRPPAGAVLLAALFAVSGGPAAAQDRLVTGATDYSTGALATLEMSAPYAPACDLAPICSDAVLRWHGGRLYVVNRYGCDNVQVVDPASWTTLHEWSVGAGTNPQDIAVISPTRAYVTRYETNDLLELDPATGATLGTISLAAFADADGLCEMHRMQVHGNRLFVQVQRMFRQAWPDPWIPSPPSLLVVIDLDTRQIVDADPSQPGVQGIVLAGVNPIAPIQVDPATGKLLVPTAGQYGVMDGGGIERVNPATLRSEGFVITESALGGDLVDFAQWTSTRAYAIVSLPGFSTALVAWNPSSGSSLGIVYDPGGYTLADLLAYPTGRLFVSDRDYFDPGIRVYSAASGALLAGPVSTCLPPNDLIVLPGATSGVDGELAETAGDGFLGPYPNPSRGAVRLTWRGTPGSKAEATEGEAGIAIPSRDRGTAALFADEAPRPVRLEVFDLHGRRVRARELANGAAEAEISWDGADAAGRPAPAGVYFLRLVLESGGREVPAPVRPVRIVR